MNEIRSIIVNSLMIQDCHPKQSKSTDVSKSIDYKIIGYDDFLPPSIISKIKTMSGKEIKFRVNKTHITLHILSNDSDYYETFFIKFISDCIHVIENVFKRSIERCKIILALTNEKKILSKDKIIKPININSGLSYIHVNKSYIIIYRKEEICKVIIHELLHIYHIHPYYYKPEFDLFLKKKHNIQLIKGKSLNIFESYVESLAVFINSIIYEEMFDSKNTFTKELKHQLSTVKQFSNYKPYFESTNVYSYVFLKYILLVNFDNILNDLKSQNYCIHDLQILLKYDKKTVNHVKGTNPVRKNKFKITLSTMDIFKTYLKMFNQ